MADLARMAIAAFGRREEGSGVIGVDVQRIRRALGLRTEPQPDLPEDDPRRTYVEFTLEPDGDGTLLRVVETGFAQLPVDTRRETYDSHSEGWSRELAELAEHVDGA